MEMERDLMKIKCEIQELFDKYMIQDMYIRVDKEKNVSLSIEV